MQININCSFVGVTQKECFLLFIGTCFTVFTPKCRRSLTVDPHVTQFVWRPFPPVRLKSPHCAQTGHENTSFQHSHCNEACHEFEITLKPHEPDFWENSHLPWELKAPHEKTTKQRQPRSRLTEEKIKVSIIYHKICLCFFQWDWTLIIRIKSPLLTGLMSITVRSRLYRKDKIMFVCHVHSYTPVQYNAQWKNNISV